MDNDHGDGKASTNYDHQQSKEHHDLKKLQKVIDQDFGKSTLTSNIVFRAQAEISIDKKWIDTTRFNSIVKILNTFILLADRRNLKRPLPAVLPLESMPHDEQPHLQLATINSKAPEPERDPETPAPVLPLPLTQPDKPAIRPSKRQYPIFVNGTHYQIFHFKNEHIDGQLAIISTTISTSQPK